MMQTQKHDMGTEQGYVVNRFCLRAMEVMNGLHIAEEDIFHTV